MSNSLAFGARVHNLDGDPFDVIKDLGSNIRVMGAEDCVPRTVSKQSFVEFGAGKEAKQLGEGQIFLGESSTSDE